MKSCSLLYRIQSVVRDGCDSNNPQIQNYIHKKYGKREPFGTLGASDLLAKVSKSFYEETMIMLKFEG